MDGIVHTATETLVGDSATSVTILAQNLARTGAFIRNTSTAILYLSMGGTATTSSPVLVAASGGTYTLPILAGENVYRGLITGIWASDAGGSASICEYV